MSVTEILVYVCGNVSVMRSMQLLPRVSSLSPITTSFPLITVLFLTAIKDAVEDYVYLSFINTVEACTCLW